MDNDKPDTAELREELQRACGRVDLLYVPGHKDIPGNELADIHAKAAARLEHPPADEALSFRTARSIIRKEITDRPTDHELAKQFYSEVSQRRDHKEIKCRKHGAMLAQLRSGHHKNLGYYEHFIHPENSDVCTRCDSGETDDVIHWLCSCPQTAAARQRIFGNHDVGVVELGRAPAKIVELAERTLIQH